jgi:hypothetical protein
MKVGASQYHPGLTVRWASGRRGAVSLYTGRGRLLASVWPRHETGWSACAYYDYGVFRLNPATDDNLPPTFTRRCDAKRAAEVLVGQWWREKCERESLPFTVADAVALVNDALASCGVADVRPEWPARGFAFQYDGVEVRN